MYWTVHCPNGSFTTELKNISCFRSIPYAESPAGSNRWKYPIPKSYQGEREVIEMGNICPQETRGYPKGEDCLNLTIWTKKGWKKKAVYFFIHGGSFVAGSSQDPNLDGEILADTEEIIVVSINYRLGVFGFLDFSFLDSDFKNNLGLYDALEALRWVYKNIEAFGGDKDNITIAGQSAGGTMVSALLTMEEVGNYISKAMILSGVPTGIHDGKTSMEIGENYLEFMNIHSKEQLLVLREKEIADSQAPFTKISGYGINTYQLSLDDYLVKEPPLIALKKHPQNIPLLLGSTKDEIASIKYSAIRKQWNMDETINYLSNMEKKFIAERKKLYRKKYGIFAKDRYYSDLIIRMPGIWYGEEYSKGNPVWYYRFDYTWTLPFLGGIGAYHSSELNYLFASYHWIFGSSYRLPWDKKNGEIVSHHFQKMVGDFLYNRPLSWSPWKEDYPFLSIHKRVKEQYFSKEIIHSWKNGKYYQIAHESNARDLRTVLK